MGLQSNRELPDSAGFPLKIRQIAFGDFGALHDAVGVIPSSLRVAWRG
jgi:hypothetical protein